MKITIKQLRQIIKESMLYRGNASDMPPARRDLGPDNAYKIAELMLHGRLKSIRSAYLLAQSLGAVERGSYKTSESEHDLGTMVEFVITSPDLVRQIDKKLSEKGMSWASDYMFDLYVVRGKAYLSIHVD